MDTHIFFVDVDGTLLRSGRPVSPLVLAAAERFREAGGRVALCTGRSPLSTRGIAREMGIDTPCVLFTGAAVYDFVAGAAVRTVALPVDVREAVGRIAAFDADLSVQAYTLERAYLIQSGSVLRERGIREELEGETTPISAVRGEILKLVLTHGDPGYLSRCAAEVFDDRYHFAFASRRFAEVVARGADKGAGARVVAEYLGVPMGRTFAAGDAMTDVPMLEACGYSFAPEDAPEGVRGRADETMPSCDADGMASAFDRAIAIMRDGRR